MVADEVIGELADRVMEKDEDQQGQVGAGLRRVCYPEPTRVGR
jgi:hypothetical protein